MILSLSEPFSKFDEGNYLLLKEITTAANYFCLND